LYRYIFIVIGEELLFPKFLATRRVTLCLLQWQVDLQLRDVPFEGNDTKNANNMQETADAVGDLLKDAAKKKLKMKFKMREVMEEINVAQLTRAYVADGMNSLRPDSTVKSKKRSRKTGQHISIQLLGARFASWQVVRLVEKSRGRRIILQTLSQHRLEHRCLFLLGLCCGLH
jgi:hypothetical protein